METSPRPDTKYPSRETGPRLKDAMNTVYEQSSNQDTRNKFFFNYCPKKPHLIVKVGTTNDYVKTIVINQHYPEQTVTKYLF